MRFQRIFWVLFFLFPNSVMAQGGVAPVTATVGEAAELEKSSQASIAKLEQSVSLSTQTPLVTPTNGAKVSAAITKATASAQSCVSKKKMTDNFCWEWASPEISSFMKQYGALMQVGAGMISTAISDQCSKMSKILQAGNLALTAFQASCGGSQAVCDSSCSTTLANAKEVITFSNAAITESNSKSIAASVSVEQVVTANRNFTQIIAEAEQLSKSIELNQAACKKHQIGIESAVIGAASALKSALQAKDCNKDTASKTGIDCNDKNGVYYNQKNCMCTRNELPAADCQNILIGNGNGIAGPDIGKSDGIAALSGDGNMGDLYGVKPQLGSDVSGPSGGGLPGAPVGGGGAVGASSGGGGGAQDGSPVGRRLNTNILGGGSGGGGGGGLSGGPGYGETDPSLKAYGPGGVKDANRTLASEMTKQVTNPAGRSNWEKVKSRYTDNLRNLTGR